MPRKAKLTTAIGVVVDESSSMLGRAEETRSAFNTYFDNIEKEDPSATVTAVTFSDGGDEKRVRYLCRNSSVTDMPYLDTKNYVPRGMTPLFDAVGEVIGALSRKKADRYLVVILTDGEENTSKEFSRTDIKALISSKEETDKWTFVFIGAGVDAWAGASHLGISTPGTSFSYSGARGTTAQTMATASASTQSYLVSTKTSDPNFFEGK